MFGHMVNSMDFAWNLKVCIYIYIYNNGFSGIYKIYGYVCIYIYIYVYVCVYIYIYIWDFIGYTISTIINNVVSPMAQCHKQLQHQSRDGWNPNHKSGDGMGMIYG